jgi:hypothetical protein
MLEMLLPEYTRQLMENYQSMFNQLASQLRWLYFDDAFRLVTKVGYLDDGWIRVRLDGHWEFTGELLRELSWTFYSIAESNRLLDLLTGALASRATDKLRVSIVDALPPAVMSIRLLERVNVSVPANSSYTLLDLNVTGRLHEVLVVSPFPDFSVRITVDGVTVWDKSYSDASTLTDELVFVSAFQREDGRYIYHVSEVPFKVSCRVEVVNLSSASITLDRVVAKYEVA